MAYNWNKFLEIGPWRETWVHTGGPLPSAPHTTPHWVKVLFSVAMRGAGVPR